MTFELNSFAISTDARALHLVNPEDGITLLYADKEETKPVQINLHGTASKAYRKAVDKMMLKNNKRGKRDATPDEVREQSTDFMVALSVSADNMVLDGEAIDSPEAFKTLYSDDKYSWVRDQVNVFVGDIANFL